MSCLSYYRLDETTFKNCVRQYCHIRLSPCILTFCSHFYTLFGTGKMLSKLARIILIAKEVGGVDRVDFNMALNR